MMTLSAICFSVLLNAVSYQPPPQAAVVAVVKIPEVSEKYKKTADLEAQFDGRRRSFSQHRDDLKGKIDRAARALQEELKPGTDEYRERRKQIAMMEAELQAFVEIEGEKVEQGLAQALRSIFDDIQAAVREIAQERGIDVVLASDELPQELPNATQQIRQQIVLQKVLYWSPRVDLTADVITRVNAKYKSPTSSAPNPAGAPPPIKPQGGGKQ